MEFKEGIVNSSKSTGIKSIQIKIALWAGICLFLAAAVIITYTGISLYNTATKTAEAQVVALAQSQAGIIDAEIETALDTARTLAQTMAALKSSGETLSREQVNAMLEQVMLGNPNFFGAYTLWEPNAFDGKDAEYANTSGHDATGRFLPYWFRSDNTVTTDVLLSEDMDVGDFYLIPKQTGKEAIIEPYFYPIAGKDVLMISLVVPIVVGGRFYGVAGVDYRLDFLQELTDKARIYEGKGQLVLITYQGTLAGMTGHPQLVGKPAIEIHPDSAAELPDIQAGKRISQYWKNRLEIFEPIYFGRTDTPWSANILVPVETITAEANAVLWRMVGIGIILVGIALVLLWVVSGRIARPIKQITQTAQTIAAGELDVEAPVTSSDEVGVLAGAFNQMTTRLREMVDTVQTRSVELEERTKELEASQRVTFAASEHATPDELLDLVVNLIRDQFDLYHAQVYMVDEQEQAAVLRQSTGYAGRQLLQRKHRIPLDATALVTRAIHTGEAVLVDDVKADPNFLPNPLLPDTRSELVVPLKREGKVIGVLDAQDRNPGRFNPSTIALFQTMTDQVAILFENSELLQRVTDQTEVMGIFSNQLRTAADIARRLGTILDPEQLLQEVVELIQSRFGLYHAHIYLLNEEADTLKLATGSGEVGRVLRERGHSIPLNAEKSLVARAARSRSTILVTDTTLESDFMPNPLLPQTRSELSLPLVVGNTVLGVLDLQDDQAGRFTEAERDTFGTLAGLVATAIQNARLFERQRQAEAAIRESQQRLSLLVQQSPLAVIEWNTDFEVVQWNEAAEHIFGYTREEALGRHAAGLIVPEEVRDLVNQVWQDLLTQKGGTRSTNDNFTKDGRIITCEWYNAPLVDANGNVLGVASLVADVTEQKRAQAALQENEERLGLALEAAAAAVWEFLPLAGEAYFDDRWYTMLGYESQELPQSYDTWRSLLHPDDLAVSEPKILQKIQVGGDFSEEFRMKTKDGGWRWIHAIGKTIATNEDGVTTRMLGTHTDITERVRAEAAVRESRRMLEIVMNSLPESIFWKDKDLVYLGCNTNFAHDAGFESPEQVIGKTDHDMPWKDQVALYQADDRHVIETGEAKIDYEEPQSTPDGGTIWLRTSKLPLYNEQGEAYAVLGAYADITEMKKAEQAVRESQQRLSLLVQQSPLAVIEWNTDFEVVQWNEAAEHIFGYTREEALGRHAAGLIVPEEVRDLVNQVWQDLLTQKGGTRSTNDNFTKDGRIITCEWYNAPLVDANGNVLGVASLVADITERVRAEAEIQKRASELQTVAEVGTAAATILEPDRLLSQVVELTKSNFGLYHAHIYLIDELGESLVLAAGAGEAGKQMLAQGWKIAADSATSLVARAFRTRAGVIVNDVRAAPDFLPNPLLPETRAELAVPLIVGERVLGVLDVQSDQVDHFTREDVAIQTTLAGQIATAIENARLFQESRQVDRLKSEFLANMSHELRTPLNSIIGYIQLLLMDLEGEIPEESYEDMRSIDTNSRHLLNLINDILDLAKIEAGRVELHLEEMDVAALLDTVKNNNAGLFINSALSFNVSAEEGLPHINADPVRINQILNNLISNAFKFTETGGVTIHAYRDNNDVCIAVQDTGIGIAEKDLEAVFERFRQVDGSFTRRAEGTGLGLSITRLLVEMHKGRLSVRSRLGEGSTFTVHLPAVA